MTAAARGGVSVPLSLCVLSFVPFAIVVSLFLFHDRSSSGGLLRFRKGEVRKHIV